MNETTQTIYIYTLSDPRDGRVRYVGASVNPTKRLRTHKKDAKRHDSSYVHKWINSLLGQGLSPVIDIVDSGNADTWQAKEKYWIQWHKDAGCDLTNSTDGGLCCQYNEKARLKLWGENSPMYGKRHSEESRRKIGESHSIPILQYDKFGNFIRGWDSTKVASKELGIHQSSITQCCKRNPRNRIAGNCIWRYATDPIPQKEQPRLFEDEDK